MNQEDTARALQARADRVGMRKFGRADSQGNPGRRKTGRRPRRKSAAVASAGIAPPGYAI
jgi:hypothetical protein